MESLTIYLPEGAEGKKVKAVLKALGVSFDKIKKNGAARRKAEKPYNPEFVAMIQKSRQEAQEGKIHSINLEEFWK